MTKREALKLFQDKKVRTVWDDEQEKWYFSIVDVVAVLTDSVDSTAYWRTLIPQSIDFIFEKKVSY